MIKNHQVEIDYDKAVRKYAQAVKGYREKARDNYACDDIEIDNDADVSFADSGVWVQAWVWIQDEDEENS